MEAPRDRMARVLRTCFLILSVSACAVILRGQEQTPEVSAAGYEFVSGTVAELPPGKIVVSRTVLGKPPETRTFTITTETKIEGKLRPKARVTVGFKTSEEGEPPAVRIIVRQPSAQSKKP